MAILRVYFFSSAVQLTSSVIGSLLPLTSPLLMRNFLPSAVPGSTCPAFQSSSRGYERGLFLWRVQPHPLSLRRSHALTVFVGSTASVSTCIATTLPFVSIR